MTKYFESGQWKVTDRSVRTPKKTFYLEKLEGVSLKRTFFLFTAAPSIGGFSLVGLWWRYLYQAEIAFILALSVLALVASYQFGTLKVEALSLRNEEDGVVYGRFAFLDTFRRAVETAMSDRDRIDAGGE